MESDAVNRRNLDGAADLSDDPAQAFLQLFVRIQHVFRLTVKNLACGGQFHVSASANALEKSAFEFFLKRSYLLTNSRLCNKVSLGRQRKALQIDQITKNFKSFDMHLDTKNK